MTSSAQRAFFGGGAGGSCLRSAGKSVRKRGSLLVIFGRIVRAPTWHDTWHATWHVARDRHHDMRRETSRHAVRANWPLRGLSGRTVSRAHPAEPIALPCTYGAEG